MSVLKNKRKESHAEYLNIAYKIYVQTIEIVSKLSARYSRLMASDITHSAFMVLNHVEAANAIYPSGKQAYDLREKHLLEAKGELHTLDVALSISYEVLMKNPSGAFSTRSGKDVAPKDAQKKLDNMSQELGELIDSERKILTQVIKELRERMKKEGFK